MPHGPVRTLKLRLNEVGWQVGDPAGLERRLLRQGERRHDRRGDAGRDLRQPDPVLACDPAVKSVLFFNLVDERNLDRWQSGLLRADWTKRPSYAIVKGSIAAGQTHCSGRQVQWRHAYKPVGVHLGFLGGTPGPFAAEHVLELRAPEATRGRCTSAGLFRVRRPGKVAPSVRAQISRSLRTGRVRGASLKSSRDARRRLGQGDQLPAQAAEARLLRVRSAHHGRDEPGAQGDVRRPAVRSCADLTRTPVRSSMANTCSVESSSSCSWPPFSGWSLADPHGRRRRARAHAYRVKPGDTLWSIAAARYAGRHARRRSGSSSSGNPPGAGRPDSRATALRCPRRLRVGGSD